MSRYTNRTIAINDDIAYREQVSKKDKRYIRQYTTPELKNITASERNELQRISVVWKSGDRLWKLASQYYSDPTLWWIISWYNQKPTESHFQIGDTVLIPLPLQKVMELFEV